MAVNLVLLRPGLLRAVELFRPVVSFQLEVIPNLTRISVYIVAGIGTDCCPCKAEHLVDILREAGAEVELRWRDVCHDLTQEEVGKARE